jgi:hypothetical protein
MRIDFVISLDPSTQAVLAALLGAQLGEIAAIARLEGKLDQLLQQENQENMTLTDLKAKVQKNTDVASSAVTLINGLAEQLRTLANDPAAIQALADQLDSTDSSLAAAITANTPAA